MLKYLYKSPEICGILLMKKIGPTIFPKISLIKNTPIIWLFFITFAFNLTFSLIALEINSVMRFMILAESHSKGAYLNSFTSLNQYLNSHSEEDYKQFRSNIGTSLIYKDIIKEINLPQINYKKVLSLMDDLKFESGDSYRFVIFFRSVRDSEFFKRNKQIMDEGSNLLLSLSLLGNEFHRNVIRNIEDKTDEGKKRGQIIVINGKMENILTEFSDKISYLSVKITTFTEITIVVIGFSLLTFGIYGCRKIIANSEIYQKALEKSEARLRLSMQQMPGSIWTTDKELKITSMTGSALADLSLKEGALVGMPVKTFLENWDTHHIALEAHQKALQGKSINCELDVLDRTWTAHVEPFRDETGSITGVLGIAYDTTAR
jgi:PAS domain-containing protein